MSAPQGEPFRLERRPATERAALAVARLEDYAETLADPDVAAADLAVHVEALEQAAITLAAVVTAVTT